MDYVITRDGNVYSVDENEQFYILHIIGALTLSHSIDNTFYLTYHMFFHTLSAHILIK
jgi:hypothetical protein